MWPGRRIGRYVKKHLSKTRRQLSEEEIRVELEEDRMHERGLPGAEREANWKTW